MQDRRAAMPKGFRSVKASTINALLKGSIDMHAHFGPDSKIDRSVDATELVTIAQDMGMRGLVLKSKDYPTQALAHIYRNITPKLETFGAVCLDYDVGGLNAEAVRTSGRLGARVVWMPTFSSESDMVRVGRGGQGISLLDKKGALVPAVEEVLKAIKEHDMVLATGHITAKETIALAARAKEMGIKRIVITHAMTAPLGAEMTLEQAQALAAQGCYIEHVFIGLMPRISYLTGERFVEIVKGIGAEHCILSTDFGQVWNPPPPMGMKMMIANMLMGGLNEDEVEVMVKTNPARVLGVS